MIRQHSFTRKERTIVYILSLSALLFTQERTVLYCMRTGAAYGVQNYEYPNIYLLGIGVMFFFMEDVSQIRFSESMKRIVFQLSGLTFGIYLSHVLLLKVYYQMGLNLQIVHPAIAVPVALGVVFAVGAMLTWLIHKVPVIGKYIA